MRRCWLLLVLAGCIHGSSSPAWPKSSSANDNDGGESLAPRPPAHEVTASTEDSTGDTPAAAVTATPAAAPVAPAVTPAATTPTEEPVQTEEMVIEIEDD
jgi:hypothetical protein